MTRTASVGGVPNSYIVLDNGIADDEQACQIKPEWHAAVCKGDYGRFAVGGNFGFGSEAIADPVMLSRNGRRYEYTGETTIRSGAEVRVETSKKDLSLSLREMDNGSWVISNCPGSARPPGVRGHPAWPRCATPARRPISTTRASSGSSSWSTTAPARP